MLFIWKNLESKKCKKIFQYNLVSGDLQKHLEHGLLRPLYK